MSIKGDPIYQFNERQDERMRREYFPHLEIPDRFPRTPDDTLDTEHEEPDPDLATTGGDDE